MMASITATTIIFWSTQAVNAVCHLPGAGYRSHDTYEDSLNVWWVALLALGEGWHNNHHAIPKSAQHGMAWWELDVTWISIVVLEKLGLAKNVIRPENIRKLAPAGQSAPLYAPEPMVSSANAPVETIMIAEPMHMAEPMHAQERVMADAP
jgi:hypothetical protein